MNIGGPPTAKDFGGAGDLLLDLEEDFPAFDGDGGDLLLDLEEDFPAFGTRVSRRRISPWQPYNG